MKGIDKGMAAPPPQRGLADDAQRALVTDTARIARASQDRIAVSPAIGPVPPIAVTGSPRVARTASNFRRAAVEAARLVGSRLLRHLSRLTTRRRGRACPQTGTSPSPPTGERIPTMGENDV